MLYFMFPFMMFILMILLSMAFFTLLESKKMSAVQSRKGPNKMGKFGFFQPVIDGMKLLLKETMTPSNSFKVVFFMCSAYSFFIGLSLWILLPFSYTFVGANLSYGLLFIFVLSMLHVYSMMLAGWSSNSHYSFLGAMRSAAQLIAYDITMVMMLLHMYLYTKSLNLLKMIEYQFTHTWFMVMFFFQFIAFFICALAETNSHPFDLPEAEAELVAGYNVEYSGMSFSLFFLGEYSSMLFMCTFMTNIFLGGWDFPFSSYVVDVFYMKMFCALAYFVKIWFLCFSFMYISTLIPSYTYYQLMNVGWKILLPFSFVSLLYNIMQVYFFLN